MLRHLKFTTDTPLLVDHDLFFGFYISMKISKNYFLVLVLLAGCTPVKLRMNVDAALEASAVVYSLNYPGSLGDKLSGNRLNVSFGDYKVTNADISWKKSDTQAEDPDPIFMLENTRKSGNSTETTTVSGGPTSLLGFSRPAVEGEPSIKKSYQTIRYKFKQGQDVAWNALCVNRIEERVISYKGVDSVEVLSSSYVCEYRHGNEGGSTQSDQAWVLSVDGEGITLSQAGGANVLAAYSTKGEYVDADGELFKGRGAAAGYSWRPIADGNSGYIAAVSVKEDPPRIWLSKGNDPSLNHVLAMASTGLLAYEWEIQK